MNKYLVGSRGNKVVISLPPTEEMTADEALELAAWLEVIACACKPEHSILYYKEIICS